MTRAPPRPPLLGRDLPRPFKGTGGVAAFAHLRLERNTLSLMKGNTAGPSRRTVPFWMNGDVNQDDLSSDGKRVYVTQADLRPLLCQLGRLKQVSVVSRGHF